MISLQNRFWHRLATLFGLLGVLAAATGAQAQPQKWLPVTTGIQYGVSGMALVEDRPATPTTPAQRQFLVVHDNKKPGEGRLSLLTLQSGGAPRYTPLAWPKGTALPVDLEALAAVPGQPGAFMALASDGIVLRLQLNEAHNAVQVTSDFKLPNYQARANFEGFSLARIGGALVAVWASRGAGATPATLSFATLDPDTNAFGPFASASLAAPWPTVPDAVALAANPALDVRAVSDLKLDGSGTLLVSSASDGGDDGPFASALYLAGTFALVDGKPQWSPSPKPLLLNRFTGHKVEAFDLVPGPLGGPIFGTDDENQGAFVWAG